jgi:hypothetical protein
MIMRLAASLIAVLVVTLLVFCGLWMLVRLMGTVGAALGRLFTGGPGVDRRPPSPGGKLTVTGLRICPNSRCRKTNVPEARYCAQCGQPLDALPPVPANGPPT